MTMPRLATLLLLTSALAAPSVAMAADEDQNSQDSAQNDPSYEGDEAPEISIPGGEIIVTGRKDRNVERAAPQVVSVLSTEQIARTGEGNIAGALARVTGLSVVGNGFVFVRGLGDRYSLALLNGSPLPSPEPLKRVVPLDLFPSSVIASSLVQKSYSANYPGEFGGGVINLTTKAAPRDGFISIGGGIGANSEATGQVGYTYYGSSSDWLGYDNGNRDVPAPLQAYFDSGERISSGLVDTQPIAKALITSRNAELQRYKAPPNFKAELSAGKSFDLGSGTLGVIVAGGYDNKWTNRGAINQFSLGGNLASFENDFYRVTTNNRVVVNGLVGIGGDFDWGTLRWTSVYIHDALKSGRLGVGSRHGGTYTYMQQDTAWYERQLFTTQVVGEFDLSDRFSLDVRGSYANSKRDAPYELYFEYAKTNSELDPLGDLWINRLNNGQSGDATISFSKLNEDLYSAGADLTWNDMLPGVNATLGYAYLMTERTSSRRDFQFTAPSDFPAGVGLLQPSLLLQPSVIEAFDIAFIETNEGNPAFLATLDNHAGYLKFDVQLTDTIQIDAGVRYETAKMAVSPIQVFNTPGASLAGTNLDNDYWLPTGTVTWNFQPDMQVRVNASKTIARPQFRELLYQFYFDPDTNRQYRGNPLLKDSELLNAEIRYEWYFDRDQRFSVVGFIKSIDRPIESFIDAFDQTTSFANAPKADLYGVEVELQKYIDLQNWGGLFENRRLVLIGNYTFTDSKLKIASGDKVEVFGTFASDAAGFFVDGSQLTGQSQHIANAQIGFEDQDGLSQQTILLSYASKRVTSRGLNGTGQPDVFEYPGLTVDIVIRQGIKLFGINTEWKFEARNITGRKHLEYQSNPDYRVDYNTYDPGTTVSLSGKVNF